MFFKSHHIDIIIHSFHILILSRGLRFRPFGWRSRRNDKPM
nr:MAG TPA: hypothetical protein [Caudoviricetes sp.]